MTKEAPVRVAECPPLGHGGTPSIYGNAQSHWRSTDKKLKRMVTYFLPPHLVAPLVVTGIAASIHQDFELEASPLLAGQTDQHIVVCFEDHSLLLRCSTIATIERLHPPFEI